MDFWNYFFQRVFMSTTPVSLSFFDTFDYNTRKYLGGLTTCVLPSAIEAFVAASRQCRNRPSTIKDNVIDLKNEIVSMFSRQSGETEEEHRTKVAKNVSKVAIGTLAMGSSIAVPFALLPSEYALPSALAAIQLTGKTLLFLDKVPKKVFEAKEYLKDAFTKRLNESEKEFHKRRKDGIKNVVYYGLIFAGTAALAGIGIKAAVLLSNTTSPWSLDQELPDQTPAVVFVEYVTLALLHAIETARAAKQKDYGSAVFHGICTAAGLAFPTAYQVQGGDQDRLHHSFIGLFFQLFSWRSIKCFGSVVLVDSLLDLISSQRGYVDANGNFQQYDYENVLMDNLPLVLFFLTMIPLLEVILDFLMKENPKEKPPGTVIEVIEEDDHKALEGESKNLNDEQDEILLPPKPSPSSDH